MGFSSGRGYLKHIIRVFSVLFRANKIVRIVSGGGVEGPGQVEIRGTITRLGDFKKTQRTRESKMKNVTIAAGLILAGAIAWGVAAYAQAGAKADPVKVDPKHYKVDFENDKVRVLRITYGPGEKSIMHYHPDGVVVYLTDGKTLMTTPDGKSQETPAKA